MRKYFRNKPPIVMTEAKFPRTILEFQDRFGTEEACEQYLFQCKWPEGFECPRCGNDYYYYVKRRRLLECIECGHQTSLTAGTIMHRTRTPLRKWFIAAYFITTLTPGIFSGLGAVGTLPKVALRPPLPAV
jgi:Zn ribbon nucleic-acid-binding protein